MPSPLRKLLIDGIELTPREASELPNSVSYAAIIKRMRVWSNRSDEEIVYTAMMTKSQCGKAGARNTPFNNAQNRR